MMMISSCSPASHSVVGGGCCESCESCASFEAIASIAIIILMRAHEL